MTKPNKSKLTCPDGRISQPSKSVGDREVIDLGTYIPGFLSSINNALSRGASQRYRAQFGIGIVEWRVMSMLAIEPNIPAVHISDAISTDKGQVSRALQKLCDAKLAESKVVSADVRKKNWWLNDAGYTMHERILKIALERERQLITGCTPEDIEAFLRVARLMGQNLSKM
ncbi:DNA-binding MarR family transcriptional regulator [Pacificibacter maritimus]|uniref:DNA-binding MarR family transcriptional regulator n=1 Tax=Pacificibacter maritimus TaxID=762213 RepID=A0A3N4V4W1_9RHOB|nr:MarR family winged helix-turn-helix transcriptional regulator [Pacificibacter maritimus]RPE72147.1 DNA-binding MarR family transcriptional regulator [Pacificibacter maritimus]